MESLRQREHTSFSFQGRDSGNKTLKWNRTERASVTTEMTINKLNTV